MYVHVAKEYLTLHAVSLPVIMHTLIRNQLLYTKLVGVQQNIQLVKQLTSAYNVDMYVHTSILLPKLIEVENEMQSLQ